MGGVDLMDSLVGLYRHTLRHKRWYFRIFHHILNVAVINSWILWKMDPENESLDLLEFKSSVSTSLIYQGSSDSSKKRGRPSLSFQEPAVKKRVRIQAATELRRDGSNHYPAKTEGKYAAKCHLYGCPRKTRYICSKCKEALCPECFEAFHSR